MRTTLTIEEDLAVQLEELRRRKGLSLKKVVNLLLKEGLRTQQAPPKPKRYRTKPRQLGLMPGYDSTKLNQLADELEAEATRDKLTTRATRRAQ